MSNINIQAIVEGQTEKNFIDIILAPYLATKSIFITAVMINKPGQKGGDVKFSRAKNDISNFLRQRKNVYVTTFIDLYGIKEWPGKEHPQNLTPEKKAEYVNNETKNRIDKICNEFNININRFIPYIAIHEFESMLFSNSKILANNLGIDVKLIDSIISECGSPEDINNSPQTAPSKRLNGLINGEFKKTTTGIAILQEIGLKSIREKCIVFNNWINKLEQLEQL